MNLKGCGGILLKAYLQPLILQVKLTDALLLKEHKVKTPTKIISPNSSLSLNLNSQL